MDGTIYFLFMTIVYAIIFFTGFFCGKVIGFTKFKIQHDERGEKNLNYKADYELVKGHDTDSGYDLRTTRHIKLLPFEVKNIPTSVFLELPKDIEGQVRPKSSISTKGVLVYFGTVDSDYRGEVMVTIQNLNNHSIEFEPMQKIAQIVFVKKYTVELVQVNEINNDTERGTGGFGSTGRF